MHVATAHRRRLSIPACLTKAQSPVRQEAGALSPVIDRPDRRMKLALRVRGYVARMRLRGIFLAACTRLASEWWVARRANLREHRLGQTRVTRILKGADMLEGAGSIALYVHYAPTPGVSAMVLDQLRTYRAAGFRIVFISMAPSLPPTALAALTPLVARIVQRRNFGLDFGAWQDTLDLVGTDGVTELLLVNDSICGPLLPIEPVFDLMRGGGTGLFGLTENLAPKPHLQSYLLLARGPAVIADLAAFVSQYRQTAYKRAVVRSGEIALSAWMRRRGHLVAACFGYEAVERDALGTSRARRRLLRLFPSLMAGCPEEAGAIRDRLQHYPLNPTHALWFELVETSGFPFLKTELLLRNPIGISDLASWRMLVAPDRLAMVEAHLHAMQPSVA